MSGIERIHIFCRVLSPECVLFKTLGKNLKYEVAVGMNGRIWIKCHTDGDYRCS